jgi:hypothetical protein
MNLTPEEKAKELVEKFNYESKHYLILDAKKCALIAIDEILNAGKDVDEFAESYWKQVKTEIEKL